MPEGFWTGAEQFLGIICPTLPTLHPLIKLAWERSTSGSSGRTPTSESDKVRGKNDFIRKQRGDKELLRKPEIGTTTPPPHDVAMKSLDPRYTGSDMGNVTDAHFNTGNGRIANSVDEEKGFPLPDNAIAVAKGFKVEEV